MRVCCVCGWRKIGEKEGHCRVRRFWRSATARSPVAQGRRGGEAQGRQGSTCRAKAVQGGSIAKAAERNKAADRWASGGNVG